MLHILGTFSSVTQHHCLFTYNLFSIYNSIFHFQECKYFVYSNSVGQKPEDLFLKSRWTNFTSRAYFKGQNLDYHAEMSFGQEFQALAGDIAIFKIHLRRKYLKDIVETIGPTALMVIVSWVRITLN